MSSTGAIGKEVSNINTALYSGAECGTTSPTVLDHTGQTLYVQHADSVDGAVVCSDFQSYRLGSTGQLTFVGGTEQGVDTHVAAPTPLTISGQNNYAFDIYGTSFGYEGSFVQALKRTASTGSLDQWNIAVTNPATYDSSWFWMQFGVAADPTNHVAIFEMVPRRCAGSRHREITPIPVTYSGDTLSGNWTADGQVLSVGLPLKSHIWRFRRSAR